MLSAPGPCLEREDDYSRIKGPWPIEKPVDYGDMAPAIRQKVRQVALGKTPSPADDALLVALFRASWLRGFLHPIKNGPGYFIQAFKGLAPEAAHGRRLALA